MKLDKCSCIILAELVILNYNILKLFNNMAKIKIIHMSI